MYFFFNSKRNEIIRVKVAKICTKINKNRFFSSENCMKTSLIVTPSVLLETYNLIHNQHLYSIYKMEGKENYNKIG